MAEHGPEVANLTELDRCLAPDAAGWEVWVHGTAGVAGLTAGPRTRGGPDGWAGPAARSGAHGAGWSASAKARWSLGHRLYAASRRAWASAERWAHGASALDTGAVAVATGEVAAGVHGTGAV